MSPRLSDLLLSSQSDERLVSLARAGHERAFAAIVERYRPELEAMARRLCSDGRSEDVVQQSFLSAFMALRSGCEVRHLRGWLYRILRNTAGRSDAPMFVPLDGTTPSVSVLEEVVQQRAMAMTALSEIARLPARQRQAMIGTALDGRARAEIASSMGLSEGAVRQLVHRARAALRSAVTALTPWPLARWIAAAGPDAPGPGELAAGAGAASSGGLALKLGALLASGTLLTGAAVQLQAPTDHRSDPRSATSVHARRAVARAQPVAAASVARPLLARAASPGPLTAGPARSVPLPVARGTPHTILHHGGHGTASTGSGLRPAGSRVGGRGDRSNPAGSGGRGERNGAGGASSPTSSGARTGSDGLGGSGGGSDGGDRTSGSSPAGSGSGDGATQMVSDSLSLGGGGGGSDSGHNSESGQASTSTSGLSSDGGSGSGGGTTSSGLSGSGAGSGSGDGGGTSGG